MTALVRRATLLAVGGLLLGGTAMAGPPNPHNSTKPAHFIAVGYTAPLPPGADPYGRVTYIIRDDLNSVQSGNRVELRFGNCTDLLVSKVATEMQGNVTVNCATNAVFGTTDGLGELTFAVVARGNGTGPPRANRDCVEVFVGEGGSFQQWANVSVATADRDGAGGVGAADFGLLISDFVLNPSAGRSDLDDSGGVGAGDFGIMTAIFVFGGSALSGAAPCP